MMGEFNGLRRAHKSRLTGEPAASQKPYTLLDLVPSEADRLFRQDYRTHRDSANWLFPLVSLPPDAQIALIDLAYQEGGEDPAGFRSNRYPMFSNAIERRDWKKAGEEANVCEPPTPTRNARRKALFEKAARQFPFHQSLTRKRKLLDLLVSSSSL